MNKLFSTTGLTAVPEHAVELGILNWYTKVFNDQNHWVGLVEWHVSEATKEFCGGFVGFDVEDNHWQARYSENSKWQVKNYDPLTLFPSIGCHSCGHHGWIENGEWKND